MSEHRIHTQLASARPGDRLVIAGEEAQHAARVKRCEINDLVGLLDGRGRTASGRIAAVRKDSRTKQWELEVLIDRVAEHPRARPRVEIWSAVPKGGRLDDMIDQLSQVGACGWAPLDTARSVAEPTRHKLARLGRIIVESAKQCGRPWLLEVGDGGSIVDAMRAGVVIFADASGTPFQSSVPGPLPGLVRVLVGPEGGWTDEELSQARSAGAIVASFGPHAMRIETAAVAAAAIVLDQFRRPRGSPNEEAHP